MIRYCPLICYVKTVSSFSVLSFKCFVWRFSDKTVYASLRYEFSGCNTRHTNTWHVLACSVMCASREMFFLLNSIR